MPKRKSININNYPATRKYISLYFHAHQPFRLSNFSIFDLGKQKYYFTGPLDQTNEYIIKRVTKRGYIPANTLLLDLLKTSGLKLSYSLSGVLLEQLEQHAPDVIDLFGQMVDTGKTELIAETYYHSLAFFHDKQEFIRQTHLHIHKLRKLFGYKAQVFRNTEFTYRNDVGEFLRLLGFKGVFAEGWDPILAGRSPAYLYKAKPVDLPAEEKELAIRSAKPKRSLKDIKLLLKHYRLSDDIAFRFQLKGWEGYPVTADKFANWAKETPGELINLCMDYETIGEHHHAESGIFEFYHYLPHELAKVGIEFVTPSEAIDLLKPVDEVDFPHIVSWADMERDLSAWTGNLLQQKSLASIYAVRNQVQDKIESLLNKAAKEELLDVWGRLQTSDHFYYMSTKYWSDGDVHKYFSPYKSPYEAFVTFQNVLRDFKLRYLS